jgi:transposase
MVVHGDKAMRPLSEDLRRRIIEARQAGAGSVEVGERFRVSRRTVARLFGQYERNGEVRPKQIGGYRRSRLQKHGRALSRWIEKQSDITLTELCERCRRDLGVTIGINALWHQLRKLGLSFKKNDARRRARSA